MGDNKGMEDDVILSLSPREVLQIPGVMDCDFIAEMDDIDSWWRWWYGVERDGQIVGCICVWHAYAVCGLYVDPPHRRQGIGGLLAKHATAKAAPSGRAWLCTPCPEFWERVGWVKTGDTYMEMPVMALSTTPSPCQPR